MKICAKCGKNKEESQFSTNRFKKDGLNWQCKTCHSEYRKDHYISNKRKYISKSKKYKEEQKNKLDEYKSRLKCVVCSESEPSCLDFHHLDPSKKEFHVSILRYTSFSKALREIEKCIVVCSNCHRKIHAGLIQW